MTPTNDVLLRLWDRMAAIYGHPWSSSYGHAPEGAAADEWRLAITGLTREQAARAIDRCRTADDRFPPTPALWRAWALGIPTPEDVRAEILAGDNSRRSPFAIAVARRMDLWAWRHADATRADRMLRTAYDATREAVMRGEPLPEPLPEIAAEPEARTVTPAVGRAAIASLADMLGEARA